VDVSSRHFFTNLQDLCGPPHQSPVMCSCQTRGFLLPKHATGRSVAKQAIVLRTQGLLIRPRSPLRMTLGVSPVALVASGVWCTRDLCAAHVYLGMARHARTLKLSLERMTKDLLTTYGLEDAKPLSVPLNTSKLTKDGGATAGGARAGLRAGAARRWGWTLSRVLAEESTHRTTATNATWSAQYS